MLIWGVLGAQGIHILAMFFPPAQKVLQVAPVSLHEWLVPFTMASFVLIAIEIFKRVKHGKQIHWPAAETAAIAPKAIKGTH
jgi:magnesium-transporting ATPase (P-type)